VIAFNRAAWAFGWGEPLAPRAAARSADIALRRSLRWAIPLGVAFGTLAAAAGAGFRDSQTVTGALILVAAVALAPLLFLGFAARIRERLDGAAVERGALEVELADVRHSTEQLRNLAYHDELTGLPNRGLLYDRLRLAITHSFRHASHLAVLFLDLDDFKAVNDRFGHVAGDKLVVLLSSVTGAGDAAYVAAKVLDAAQAPFRLEGHEISITTSLGVSVYPADGASAGELMKSADAAMYREKRTRRPCACGASSGTRPSAGLAGRDRETKA
jgi:GGDEF domain-containing protein